MRKPFVKHVLCAGLCAAAIGTTALAAHSAMTAYAAESSSTTDTAADKKQPPEDDGSVMAKVTSISGNTLTVQAAQKPGSGENQSKPADGETPPEKPADGQTPPEKPADGETPPEKPADGETPPEKPADDASKPADDGNRPEMSFDGETLTLKLTSSTEYTSRGNSSVSKSDISEGSVLRLTLDGTTVTRVDIMSE